ncbi:MAG: hypothetical protein A2W28_05120 [Gammaproteobacteria bacterium RBG_16_51_14]|nr:MAG: hypothetical protein A2W28_05120 [Gammaproteobacteria bacterium RBG_16_51_14]
MLKHLLIIIAIIFCDLLLTGCAGTAGKMEKPDLEQRLTDLGYSDRQPINSISEYQLDGWQYVDEQHLIINSGPGVHYLVELHDICYDMRYADNIRFNTSINRLMTGDQVIASHYPDIKQTCSIRRLYQLKKTDEDYIENQ